MQIGDARITTSKGPGKVVHGECWVRGIGMLARSLLGTASFSGKVAGVW